MRRPLLACVASCSFVLPVAAQRMTEIDVRPDFFYRLDDHLCDASFAVVTEWAADPFSWVSLHAHDTDRRETWRLGEVEASAPGIQVDRNWIAMKTREEGDWNGNGFVGETVWAVFDLARRERVVAVSAGSGSRLAHGSCLVGVNEFGEGDIDGDGVLSSSAQMLIDLESGATDVLPSGSSSTRLGNGYAVFTRWEGVAGDLNGDGDTFDRIAHLLRPGAPSLDLGIAAGLVGLVDGPFRSEGPLAAFHAVEGGTDWNGDGSVGDGDVLHVLDARTGVTTNLGLSAHKTFQLAPPFLWFCAKESEQGDLGGDGDALDLVLFVHDARTGVTRNTGLALPWGLSAHDVGPSGRFLGLLLPEAGIGQDANGDGDELDEFVTLVDGESGQVWHTGLDADWRGSQWSGERYVVAASEANVGLDYNADADQDDHVLFVLDPTTPQLTNTGLALVSSIFYQHLVAHRDDLVFALREADLGLDRNGDGDLLDDVIHQWRAATGTLVNLGLAAPSSGALPFLRNELLPLEEVSYVPVVVDEAAQGVDLNGNGVGDEHVLHYLDLTTGRVRNSRFVLGSEERSTNWVSTTRDAVHAMVTETDHGFDLNGDGVLQDTPRVYTQPAPFRRHRARTELR